MKDPFEDIIPSILEREGGYVNNENDRGGETYKGISRNAFPDWEGWGLIDLLKRNSDWPEVLNESGKLKKMVRNFYFEELWEPSKADKMPPQLREHYFDMVVNHGQQNAVAILQKAAVTDGKDIKVDGIIGPNTMEAVTYLDLKTLIYERVLFYASIVLEDSSQKVFWKGWMNRCLEFLIDK